MKRLAIVSLILGIIGVILVLTGQFLYRPFPLLEEDNIRGMKETFFYRQWAFCSGLFGGVTSLLAVLIGIAPLVKRATRRFTLTGIVLGIAGIILFYILFGTDVSGVL